MATFNPYMIFPFGGVIIVTSTVFQCYRLAKMNGHLPDGLFFPAISQLGIDQPEKRVYQLGFAITAILVLGTIWAWFQLMMEHVIYEPGFVEAANQANVNDSHDDDLIPTDTDGSADGVEQTTPLIFEKFQSKATQCIIYGIVAAVGIFLQGVFTLEMQMSVQSMIHFAGALMFCMCAMQHTQMANNLYEVGSDKLNSPLLQEQQIQNAMWFRKMVISLPIAMFIIPVLFQVFGASQAGQESGRVNQSAANTNMQPMFQPMHYDQLIKSSNRELLHRVADLRVSTLGINEKDELANLLVKAYEKGRTHSLIPATEDDGSVMTAVKNVQKQPGSAENSMGLMQWMLVGTFVLYFGSYGIDFAYAYGYKTHLE